MADFIRVTLTPDRLQLAPGDATQAEVTFQNASTVVDVFTLEVLGLDQSWFKLSSSSASLFPGDSATSVLSISVPRSSAALAGAYPFKVRVSSRKGPSQETTVEGSLEVLPFYSYEMSLRPQKVAGAVGSFTLGITNEGNAELSIGLEGSDPEGLCRFSFEPRRPRVAPGQKLDVKVTVEPGVRPWRGQPRKYSLTFTAYPAQGTAQESALYGELEATPRLPRWAIPVAAGCVVALVAIVALVVLLSGGGEGAPQPTPTATRTVLPAVTTIPVSISLREPLVARFDLQPRVERSFEVVVNEPGLVVMKVRWNVTGNGLRVLLEVAEISPAFLEGLARAGLPTLLFEKEMTAPEEEFAVPIAQAYAGHSLRVRLTNETDSATSGELQVSFSPQPTPTPVVSTPTATLVPTRTPAPTATATPAPTVTPTPLPRWSLKVTTSPDNVGSVFVDPPSDRAGSYAHGTPITLSAEAPRGCTFTGWTGDLASSEPKFTFKIESDTALVANFACRITPPDILVTPIIVVPLTPVAIQQLAVTSVRASVESQEIRARCFTPAVFLFHGVIETNGVAGTVTYRWVNSDGAASEPQKAVFEAGVTSQDVSWPLSLPVPPFIAVEGRMVLEVLEPVAMRSEPVVYRATCQ